MRLRYRAFVLSVALLTTALPASAQNYPARPVRFVVGTGQDMIARMVGEKLSAAWGQQVIVDTRPGGGGINAAEIVAKAAPDGYTWLCSTAVYTIHAGLYPKPPFHIVADYAPVRSSGRGLFCSLSLPRCRRNPSPS